MLLQALKSKHLTNGSIEATYADGYVHSEAKLKDVSPYAEGRNIFYDILKKLPEAVHGQLIRFSVYHNGEWHHIEWTEVPKSARPVRLRDMERDRVITSEGTHDGEVRIVAVRFGYEYAGKQVITELT